MTTLARRSSSNAKVEYKDYVHFIENYKNGKDSQFSSRTSSTTSLNSDSSKDSSVYQNNNTKCESYSTFLENSKYKKFGSVRPPIPKSNRNDDLRRSNSTNIEMKKKIFEGCDHVDRSKEVKSKLIEHLNKLNKSDEFPLPPAPICDPYMDVPISNEFPPPPPCFMDSKTAPPPPPMPVNFTSKTLPKVTMEKQKNVTATIQILPTENNKNGVRKSNGIEVKHTNTIDKNNPLVRKLVYGAMLDMYGAYHDKANSYVSTLPKNMVKKQNGLQDIINNIAAQGGLDKLSGRANPKSEND